MIFLIRTTEACTSLAMLAGVKSHSRSFSTVPILTLGSTASFVILLIVATL